MLGPTDPLIHRPQRILVAGVSGTGKTTLARRVADQLDLPYREIDALFHGPNWMPRESFVADVTEFTAAPTWVTEYQYNQVRPLLADRADTLVWLDNPTVVSLWRVVRRTIRRSRSREILWNGNIEPPLRSIFVDPENIIRWAVKTRHTSRRIVPPLAESHPRMQIVHLRSQRDVERWLAGPLREAPSLR